MYVGYGCWVGIKKKGSAKGREADSAKRSLRFIRLGGRFPGFIIFPI